MREIKFRAWDNVTAQLEPEFLKHITAEDGTEFATSAFRFIGGKRTIVTLLEVLDHPEHYVVMQFTGLKDREGREIYEGDILSDGNSTVRVQWSDKDYADSVGFGCISVMNDTEYNIHYAKWKVIGNIYENSDLLV